MPISTLTYRYRVKDSTSGKHLQTIWNDCREVSMQAWPRHRGWLSGFDLITLTAGSSKLLGLHSDTVAEGCRSWATRGAPFRTWRLKWLSRKRSLGWVPFKARSCRIAGDTIKLGMAQRARKKRQVAAMHAKLRNTRKDWAHKVTTDLVRGAKPLGLVMCRVPDWARPVWPNRYMMPAGLSFVPSHRQSQ